MEYKKTTTEGSKISQQNNSEKVINENDKEIPKERYISPEEKLNKYYISKINNTQIDNAKYTDVVMPMYNLNLR